MSSPSAQFSLTLRVEFDRRPGMLGAVATAIGDAGGSIGDIETVELGDVKAIREMTVDATDAEHGEAIAAAVEAIEGASLLETTDRTFELHRGGKLFTGLKTGIRTRDDLSRAYTPGVARVCSAIESDPEKAFEFTIKRNTVAVVTDGTAVLGLGDVGPEAALPVMEGKAVLFKEFGDVDAFPVCLDTKDPDEIVRTVEAIAPGFGGINLEDIAAPRCFEIERRLRERLDIPVFHDDQHGTAIVVLAALMNALRVVNKRLPDLRVVISGVGAAGSAIIRLLQAQGVRDIVAAGRTGVLSRDEDYADPTRRWIAENTNPRGVTGSLRQALADADVFIGVSAPHLLDGDDIATMADRAIVFALSNPDPEVDPLEARKHAAVVATGRSD